MLLRRTVAPNHGRVKSVAAPDEALTQANDAWASLRARLRTFEHELSRLVNSSPLRFDATLHGALPEVQGVYRIFNPGAPEQTLRAGRTKTAAVGLRQRVYQNHFMGDQPGNLRAQLVADGTCRDMDDSKRFIRERLVVQVLVVEDEQARMWLEYFMLAVLQPRYCG